MFPRLPTALEPAPIVSGLGLRGLRSESNSCRYASCCAAVPRRLTCGVPDELDELGCVGCVPAAGAPGCVFAARGRCVGPLKNT